MRYRVLYLSLLLLVLSQVAWTPPPQPARPIRVGAYENAPKIYTADDGTISGFWPDLMRAIAAKENWEIEWVTGTWEECLQRLQGNEIDILPDTGWTEERSGLYAFNEETVLTSWTRLYVPKGSNIKSILDLEGKTIAGLAGSFNMNGPEGIKDLTASFGIHSAFVEMDSYTEVFEALEKREVDAGITNKDFGTLNERNYAVERTPIIFQPARIQFAFTKDAELTPTLIEAIDADLKELKQDPGSVYYQALEAHLGARPATTFVGIVPTWLKNMLLLGAGVIAFLLAVGITSRTQVQRRTAALRASEARYRTLFDSARDGLFVIDMQGRYIDVNLAACQLLGYSREELLAMDVFQVGRWAQGLSPEERAQSLTQLQARWRNGAAGYESELVTESGAVVPVEMTITPVTYYGDEAVLGAVRDVTERKQAEETLQQYARRLESLHEVDRAILAAQSQEAIAHAALSRIRELVPCQRASVAVFDPEADEATVLAVHIDGETTLEAGQRLSLEAYGIAESLRRGETTVVANLAAAPQLSSVEQTLLGEGVRSYVSAPLMAEGKLIGALDLGAETPDAFGPEQVEIAREVADQLAVTFRQARLYEASQRKSKDLATLLEVSQALTSTLEMEAVLQTIVERATQLIGLDAGALYLVHEDELYLGATTPPIPPGFPDEFRQASLGDHLHIHESVSTGQPVILPDAAAAELSPAERTILASRNMRSLLYVPLLIGTRPVGVLILGTQKETRSFSQAEIDLYRTLSAQAALAVENARLFGEIQRHAQELEQRVADRTAELQARMAEVNELNRAMTNLLQDLQATNQRVTQQAAELAVARDRAEAADRVKSAFLATMSHELRTPLNSIIGFTGIILQGLVGPLNPEQDKQLHMVQDSARHLLALINDVLDISKIEAGQLRVAIEPFDMRTALQKSLQTVAPLAEKKGLALSVEVAPQVGRIASDRRRVEQILINLLNNAVKFTERGEVRLTCAIEDGWLVTRVIDTGIGIQKADLKTLFEPFQQLDAGITRQFEGTGLGLSICKRLIELLHGIIEVESEPGQGSVFTFTLPIERTEP